MMKRFMLVVGITVGLLSLALAGCQSKVEDKADQAAAMEKTVEDTTPAAEHPATDKPKDHPAH